MVVRSDGSIWFSDPLYGISTDYEGGRQTSEQPPALYRLDPASGDIRVMASDFAGPNGLAFSPDEGRLYVAETGDQTPASTAQRTSALIPLSARSDRIHAVSPGAARVYGPRRTSDRASNHRYHRFPSVGPSAFLTDATDR